MNQNVHSDIVKELVEFLLIKTKVNKSNIKYTSFKAFFFLFNIHKKGNPQEL